MDVLIVAQYFGDIENLSSNNNRFVYLAGLLAKKHNVEVLTTSFVHIRKKQGEGIPSEFNGYRITALSEPGYKKNICLKRFYSHSILANRMKRYLKTRKKPDVVYCAVPSLDCADVVAKYAKQNKIPFIIDVQDLWPEAFQMVFGVPVLSKLVFTPLKRKADRIYKKADKVVAVSDTYIDRVLSVNETCKEGHTVFLGTRLETYDEGAAKAPLYRKTQDEVWIGYCGSLAASYDIPNLIYAIRKLEEKGFSGLKLILMGDGTHKSRFEQIAEETGIDVVFTGRLPYDTMCAQLNECDIVVNPIRGGSAASIINKHGDYAASGKPVVNSQDSREYRNLIDKYQMGLNCKNEDAEDMAQKLERLITDKQLRIKMGENARRCAEEKFDRKISYQEIVGLIENSIMQGENH